MRCSSAARVWACATSRPRVRALSEAALLLADGTRRNGPRDYPRDYPRDQRFADIGRGWLFDRRKSFGSGRSECAPRVHAGPRRRFLSRRDLLAVVLANSGYAIISCKSYLIAFSWLSRERKGWRGWKVGHRGNCVRGRSAIAHRSHLRAAVFHALERAGQ